MPPLGFITKSQRTATQHVATTVANNGMVAAALPIPQLAKGESVRLFTAWKDPTVVADVGFAFDRIHQLTGSCVWAGGTNALFSTIAAQRLVATNPTKAFLPFTLHNYAMSRHYMGDDGQGEGSMGSTFAQSLSEDGVIEWTSGKNNLPTWTDSDGVTVSGESVEMKWSSYRNSDLKAVLAAAKIHLVGSASPCKSVQDIKAAVLNGYGVSFACDNYIGHGSIQGSGADACVTGYWDSRGGHQQSIHAYWEHPNLGPLYWAQNNWPGSTYPQDPAGGPICGVWVPEAKVQSALQNLDAEVYALSHLDWFPAQPGVLDWFV